MKNMKGITLIALVITIVVLIILAGVAISLSIGENGIFNKAKYATEEYANEQAREETEIAKYANQLDAIVNLSNRGSETQIYKSQTFNQTSFAVITGNIPELSITVDKGTYLVGQEGLLDYTSTNLSNVSLFGVVVCTNSNINTFLTNPIVVELNEATTLTFATGTSNKVRMRNVTTYAIKLK